MGGRVGGEKAGIREKERGGVGEGEKPEVEGRTEEEMIRAMILV
jgi:hypothetical protein